MCLRALPAFRRGIGKIARPSAKVPEMRIHTGPGYRVYCWQDGATVVVALGGGDKSTQSRDIAAAQAMVRILKE